MAEPRSIPILGPRPRKAFVDPTWSSEVAEEAVPEPDIGALGVVEAGAPWPRRRTRAVEKLDSVEEPDSVEVQIQVDQQGCYSNKF